MFRFLLLPALLFTTQTAYGEPTVITDRLHHLRQSGEREWSEFPPQPEADSLRLSFQVTQRTGACCLKIRHQNLKERWNVRLNDHLLGTLPVDENDMVTYLPVPAEAVSPGDNSLVIDCPRSRAPDDIRVGMIELIDRPRAQHLSQAVLQVHVTERPGTSGGSNAKTASAAGIPCRITLLDEHGTLRDTGAESNDHLAVRSGTVYTSTGHAEIPVEPGTYRIVAGRGFEYSIDRQTVTVTAGQTHSVHLAIQREVATPGWVACDTHVHTRTHSGHGDCTVQERMITLAGEGIELPVATDHNVQIDHEPFAREMKVRQYFTPVIGNEVTTKLGHFNIFPADRQAPVPDHQGTDWPTVFDSIFRTPGVQAVILNHARDLHGGFRPFGARHFNDAAGVNIHGWHLRANAMETLNSSATQTDILRLFHDWMALLNSGHRITPVGSSDSHDVARHFVGQGRTYIRCDDSAPGNIDVAAAARAFVDGAVMVSYGLLTELHVDGVHRPGDLLPVPAGQDMVPVRIRVLGPHWSQVDRIQLFANGIAVHDEDLTELDRDAVEHASLARPTLPAQAAGRQPGVKHQFTVWLPRPDHDVHLVAIATGPGIRESWWKTARPYQPDSPDWIPKTLGCSGAVWLDADGDGQRSCAADYAETVTSRAAGDVRRLTALLADCDAAVAVQAARLFQSALGDPVKLAGKGLEAPDAQAAIATASAAARDGIRRYLAAVRRNRIAILSP